jgi:hypothetical protein
MRKRKERMCKLCIPAGITPCYFCLFLDERDPSKWLAYLSEGRVGASSTGEIMWLLDLSQPALTHQGIVPISQDGRTWLLWSVQPQN